MRENHRVCLHQVLGSAAGQHEVHGHALRHCGRLLLLLGVAGLRGGLTAEEGRELLPERLHRGGPEVGGAGAARLGLLVPGRHGLRRRGAVAQQRADKKRHWVRRVVPRFPVFLFVHVFFTQSVVSFFVKLLRADANHFSLIRNDC